MKPRITKAKPTFISHSKETGTDYRIYVDAPDPGRDPGPWPAVLFTDGDFFFDPAAEAYRSLLKSGRVPPSAIIGVGYGAGFGKPGNFRVRDYTPTRVAGEPTSGGADRFLGHLTGALWPELARRYPLRETGRAIAGHSVGSLFALHAIFQDKPFFSLALASAPSIWWDDRVILRQAEALRDRQPALSGHLYLGVGKNDTPSMLGDLGLLKKQLRDRPFRGLTVDSKQFPGHDHYDVLPLCFGGGLAALLG